MIRSVSVREGRTAMVGKSTANDEVLGNVDGDRDT